MCASGNISNLRAVVVCFNPKFGGGRFGPAENEHFLKAANFAIQEKVDMWIVIYQSSGIDVHTGVTGLAGMTKSVIAMNEIKKNRIFQLLCCGTCHRRRNICFEFFYARFYYYRI